MRQLVLMRVKSVADLAHVAEVFSFVPPGLVDRATTLRARHWPGEISSHPALVHFGSRISHETRGGGRRLGVGRALAVPGETAATRLRKC